MHWGKKEKQDGCHERDRITEQCRKEIYRWKEERNVFVSRFFKMIIKENNNQSCWISESIHKKKLRSDFF